MNKLRSSYWGKKKTKKEEEARKLFSSSRLRPLIGFSHRRTAGTGPRAEAGGPPSWTWLARRTLWRQK